MTVRRWWPRRWGRPPPGPATCAEAQRALQAYLDGALLAADGDRIRGHLEQCRRCGMEAAVYRELKAALARRAPAPDPATVRRLERFGEALARRGSIGSA
ncbi:MAG TPA: zf-HC2 domain-containing protein [Candidatus Micrarchaeia archaeon]|nr:zf-HC2 domain-containing protein [Candidatus Micrarchaeia archaeon]